MKICVFCSSSSDISDDYKKSAFRLGKTLVEQGHTLVYGGATGGLMDAVAEGAQAGKGEIIGVIPEAIIKNRRLSNLPTKLIKVPDMNERKKQLQELSDVFVALPGSFGTLDEMFSVIASGMVGEHNKLLICVNENRFYDALISHIEFMQTQCSTAKSQNYQPIFVQSVEECLERIKNLDI
ncbi:conserved hypothetical protein [uncultured Paludibacter sp.]|nr:conserved hypothetical protein [uncultured Paludibacter sp.]